MIDKVHYKRLVNFEGRNGYFQCSGLDAVTLAHYDSGPAVVLQPLTSRGDVGRCAIQIPVESIPEVIRMLDSFWREAGGKHGQEKKAHAVS